MRITPAKLAFGQLSAAKTQRDRRLAPPPRDGDRAAPRSTVRLGPNELAFVRCWAEGLDLAVAWHRYRPLAGARLGADAEDARPARAVLRQLLDQLRALARAQGRPDLAALLRRDPEAIAAPPAGPGLDGFREQQPADFYSEAELQALYQQAHGRDSADGAVRRRQRLRERLLRALAWLEPHAAAGPAPGDPVAAWLDARIADRLAQVGIRTLGEWHWWMRTHGQHWHRRVPRLGPAGAQRLQAWWQLNAASLGPLPDAVGLTRRQAARHRAERPEASALSDAAIRPLESFLLTQGPQGPPGTPGLPAGSTGWADDRQAILDWLQASARTAATARSYRQQAERLWLWALLERRKPLAALTADDAQAFRAFLAAPPATWCAPRHLPRHDPAWRPLEGALSPRSIDTALAVLASLHGWLMRRRALPDPPAPNPWRMPAADRPLMEPMHHPPNAHPAQIDPPETRPPDAQPLHTQRPDAQRPDPQPTDPQPAAGPVDGGLAIAAPAGQPAPVAPPSARLAPMLPPPIPEAPLPQQPEEGDRAWALLQRSAGAPPLSLAQARGAALLQLSRGCGLRRAELVAARWGWLRPAGEGGETDRLCIPPAGGSRARCVPLPPQALAALAALAALHPLAAPPPPAGPLRTASTDMFAAAAPDPAGDTVEHASRTAAQAAARNPAGDLTRWTAGHGTGSAARDVARAQAQAVAPSTPKPWPSPWPSLDGPIFARRDDPGRALSPDRLGAVLGRQLRRWAVAAWPQDRPAAERMRRASLQGFLRGHIEGALAAGEPPARLRRRLGLRSRSALRRYAAAVAVPQRVR